MNLDGNQFDAVPEGLCAITSLTELRMNQNKIRTLPPATAQLVKLQVRNTGSI